MTKPFEDIKFTGDQALYDYLLELSAKITSLGIKSKEDASKITSLGIKVELLEKQRDKFKP
tara:strand:- start:1796 stop:1978 length:183 start_codon:yes stop_codon:yes gene_type:complete